MTDTATITAEDYSLHLAFVQGREWAEALHQGDTFRGSYGEAKARGMDENHARFFSAGGQVGLTGKSITLTCNSDNVIHSIG
jgi:hypothetical protein